MMPLTSIETKHLVMKGLKEENIHNPFLSRLIEKNRFSIGETISPTSIAWYVAPYINAMTRSGELEEKEILFQAMLNFLAFKEIPSTKRGRKPNELETIVTQAIRVVDSVKRRQGKSQDAGLLLLEQLIEKNDMINKHKVFLFLLDKEKIDKNIIGLVANKIMSKYQRPCCILIKNEESYQGSARGCELCGIFNFKDICENTQEIEWARGHQNAFGLSININNIDNFLNKIDDYLQNIPNDPIYYVDYLFNNYNIDVKIISDIAHLQNCWGQNLPEPLIAIDNLRITKDMITIYKKTNNTIKIQLKDLSIVFFRATKSFCDILESINDFIEIKLVGLCSINQWMGNESIQIIAQDYEIIG